MPFLPKKEAENDPVKDPMIHDEIMANNTEMLAIPTLIDHYWFNLFGLDDFVIGMALFLFWLSITSRGLYMLRAVTS